MINYNLFSEIYGCYFTVVNKILEEAQTGMTMQEIETFVQNDAFYDSAFHLVPKLISEDWSFLEKQADNKYYTIENLNSVSRPLTNLEKSWLKAILLDKRISLFLSTEDIAKLNSELEGVLPLFEYNQFHYTDLATDGDPYNNTEYINNFKALLLGCKTNQPLKIVYESAKDKTFDNTIIPYKIIYSSKDDKFRLQGVSIHKNNQYHTVNLNLSRIVSVEVATYSLPNNFEVTKHIKQTLHPEPITLSISTKRHALQRCMLQFASWEKETEYDKENDCYICKLYYEKQDESELLIRILSFGPVVKVLGHEKFLSQVKERVFKQYELIN